MHLHKYITRVHTMLVLCCQFYPCSEAILSYARTPCPMTGLPSVVCGWVPFARAYPYVCAYPVLSPPPARASLSLHRLLPPSLSLSVIATFIFKVSWARYETGWIVFPLFPTFPYEQPWIPRMEMNVDYFIYRVVVVGRIIVYC